MVLERVGQPLEEREVADPVVGSGQVRIRVSVCGVCRTDLHIIDGELRDTTLPLILGHQIVGVVDRVGDDVHGLAVGDRVGVPWLGWTDGSCAFCTSGRENLCEQARFTGYQLPGGYAELAVADARFCLRLPVGYPDLQAAPLLCAGLIGYRALTMTGAAERLGIYGFGAAAHILVQVARHQHRRVFAFTRPADETTQAFARELGAEWAGSSTELPPEPLDAAILFAPVGELVPPALRAVAPGGTVVCAEIHMSDIPSFPYELLWHERVLRSVANLTRADGAAFLALAPAAPIRTHVRAFPLGRANEALASIREGAASGAVALAVAG
jgi:propanol-preferring alcohol dehydrogenase